MFKGLNVIEAEARIVFKLVFKLNLDFQNNSVNILLQKLNQV